MYTGAVSITTDTDVAFFLSKVAQLNVINGPVTISPALITNYTDLATVTKAITSVVGGNAVTINAVAAAAKAVNLSNLISISGTLTVNGAALVPATAVDISKLSSVSGAMVYSLDGPISFPLLSNVGGTLTITPYTTTGTTILGTTSVNIPMATVVGGIVPAAFAVPSATSVIMPATGLTSIVGAVIDQLTIVNTATLPALTLSPKSTATVDLSGVTKAAALTITAGTTVNMSKVAEITGALSITTASSGTVNLDLLVKGNFAIGIAGAKVISLPLWTGGAAAVLTAPAATTISMLAHDYANVASIVATPATLKTLTLGAVANAVNLTTYTALETVSVTGAPQTSWATLLGSVDLTGVASLKTATFGGNLASVTLVGNTAMTSLTTSGAINSFTLTGATNASFTSLTLGHMQFESVPATSAAAYLSISGCTNLTSVTASSLNKLAGLVITGNTALWQLSLPALVTKPTVAAAVITITGNAFRGSFTPAVLTVPLVSPFTDAVIHFPVLNALAAWKTSLYATTATTLTLTMEYNNDATSPYAVAAPTLSALMTAQAGVATYAVAPNLGVIDAPAGAITSKAEWSLVQN